MHCFDIQINGAFGVDFSDPALTRESFLRTAEKILACGTTRFLPTVITSSDEVYAANLPLIASAVESAGLQYEIPGFHLEGPFISPLQGAVGAHDPALTLLPSPGKLKNLYELSRGMVKIITMAPEMQGAVETAEYAKKLGICVSIGHHLASSEQMKALKANALTHLGNGIPNMIDRHRNPIWSGLADDSLVALVICDGHHLPHDVLKCFIRCKTPDRMIVISDASSAAGLPPGSYKVLGNDALLYENGLLYNPKKKCLVGSASMLPDCIAYLMENGLLDSAELERTAWLNPHRLLSLSPDERIF